MSSQFLTLSHYTQWEINLVKNQLKAVHFKTIQQCKTTSQALQKIHFRDGHTWVCKVMTCAFIRFYFLFLLQPSFLNFTYVVVCTTACVIISSTSVFDNNLLWTLYFLSLIVHFLLIIAYWQKNTRAVFIGNFSHLSSDFRFVLVSVIMKSFLFYGTFLKLVFTLSYKSLRLHHNLDPEREYGRKNIFTRSCRTLAIIIASQNVARYCEVSETPRPFHILLARFSWYVDVSCIVHSSQFSLLRTSFFHFVISLRCWRRCMFFCRM